MGAKRCLPESRPGPVPGISVVGFEQETCKQSARQSVGSGEEVGKNSTTILGWLPLLGPIELRANRRAETREDKRRPPTPSESTAKRHRVFQGGFRTGFEGQLTQSKFIEVPRVPRCTDLLQMITLQAVLKKVRNHVDEREVAVKGQHLPIVNRRWSHVPRNGLDLDRKERPHARLRVEIQ